MSKRFPFVLLAALVLTVAPAAAQAPVTQATQATLSLGDLANRPERWPATVTLRRDFSFGNGARAAKGQSARVLEFPGGQVLVDAGGGLVFDVDPGDCDLLEGANRMWSSLTPAQRAVDAALLDKDVSLWPERVTCSGGFQLDDGSVLAPGGEYEFMKLEGSEVHLWSQEHDTTLVTDLAQTDLITRARQRALLEPEKRPSRITAALKGNLVDAAGKPAPDTGIEGASVYVLYFGASWCGPCRKFSPSLVKFAGEVAAANPKLALVLMSNDKEDADMLEYMREEKMPWPAMPLAKIQQGAVLRSYAIGSIPHLVVLDRYGKVLTSSYQNGRYVGPDKALADLRQMLATGIAR